MVQVIFFPIFRVIRRTRVMLETMNHLCQILKMTAHHLLASVEIMTKLFPQMQPHQVPSAPWHQHMKVMNLVIFVFCVLTVTVNAMFRLDLNTNFTSRGKKLFSNVLWLELHTEPLVHLVIAQSFPYVNIHATWFTAEDILQVNSRFDSYPESPLTDDSHTTHSSPYDSLPCPGV